MQFFKPVTIILYFHCLGLNIFPQSGGNINFNDYIPSGCSNIPILTIGLIADPQYCNCDAEGSRYYRETMWKLSQAMDTMNKYQVDFVMNLGDMIDRSYESYDSVSKHYEKLNMPYYNLLGNHEFYGIADELKSSIVSRYGMPGYYYAYVYDDWRFLVLDGTELAAYSRYVHPDLAEEGDSVWNSVQGMINDESWNGGISKAQQTWMRSEIEVAAASDQNVMLFCHFPVYPGNGDHNLWNDIEIVTLLEQYPNVVAYINGHLHECNYGGKNNIHYYTQAAMLDTYDSNGFSILRIYSKEIKIQGFGRVPDRAWQYESFKKKVLQINLSETILHYYHLKNDLTGYLSFVSPDPNTLINFVLDTTRYSNRYFRVSNDSLILNTDEDLSAITDLKIDVIAVDCDADTFSQTFSLLFDTTVMKFRYNLPDTVISIYSNYVLSIDSMIDDYSKYGISMDVNIENAGTVTYSVFNDSVVISPVRVGKSTITLVASDQFTGKNFQEVFRMEVFDPLNHAPYHPDSVITDFIVQLNDTVVIPLAQIFVDPDNDLPDYWFGITDTAIVTGWLQDRNLFLEGLMTGVTHVAIFADDGRGGLDSVSLNIRVNSAPFHSDTITSRYIIQLNERLLLNMQDVFHDSDDDSLSFDYLLPDPAPLEVLRIGDTLNILGFVPGISDLAIIANDRRGGLDSVSLNIRVNSAPFHSDTITSRYIIQLNERLLLNMQDVFHDSDDDSLSFDYLLPDPAPLEVLRIGDTLNILGHIPGISPLTIIADDNYGGTDTLWYSLLINSEPIRIKEYSRFLYQFVQGCAGTHLDSIFSDPDSDTIAYQFFQIMDSMSIDDASQLILCPENPGIYKVYLSLTDNKGGSLADSLEVRFNAPPEALQQQYQFTFEAAQEQIIMNLNNIFADADDDTLGYAVTQIHTGLLIYNILEDILQLYPQVADTLEFFVIASDNYGGKDSITIRLIYVPELNAVIASQLINNLKIFPNPASGVVHLQFGSSAGSPFGIRLSDQNGRIIYQADGLRANQGSNDYILDIEGVKAKGLFFLTLDMDDGQSIINSIIIE